MVSVPNDWTEEDGLDPNPHHFHVYDWGRLLEELEGVGFAIPIDRVRRVVQDLVETGSVRHAWIGADVEARGSAVRRQRDVRIARVVPGSPAEEAGLRAGMVVERVNGNDVRTPLDWQSAILLGRVGEPMEISIAEPRQQVLRVVPADLPSVGAERIQALNGLQLVSVNSAIRAERGVRSEMGALIVGMPENARGIGLQEGDVLLQVNRLRVGSAEDAAQALQAIGSGPVIVYFERNGQLGSAQFIIR